MIDGNLDTVTFGWYGKSPAAGDFVSRRLSRPIIAALDRWFQSGMTALRERMPDAWHNYYAKAPVWRTLLPAAAIAPQPCLAVVAASSDRVGRSFPFGIVATLPAQPNGWIRSLPQAGEDVSRLVEQSLRTLRSDDFDQRLDQIASRVFGSGSGDDIGSVLGELSIESGESGETGDLATVPLNAQSAFPWPDLAQRFEPAGTTSYWWTGANRASAGFMHDGSLDADLFVTLFGDACRAT